MPSLYTRRSCEWQLTRHSETTTNHVYYNRRHSEMMSILAPPQDDTTFLVIVAVISLLSNTRQAALRYMQNSLALVSKWGTLKSSVGSERESCCRCVPVLLHYLFSVATHFFGTQTVLSEPVFQNLTHPVLPESHQYALHRAGT